jgi:hypothetical protein
VRFLSAAIDFSAAQNWSSMLMLVLWPLMTMERLIIVDFMTRGHSLSLLWSRVPVSRPRLLGLRRQGEQNSENDSRDATHDFLRFCFAEDAVRSGEALPVSLRH